ncbi:alpha-2-macroglobulin family protein [Roseofilum casamattae]|uniref:Alpha-2-macroglobulin family protein n=1 Tax=Roseofilum casamattae BLCC-M143 TaxID=3022442 RepID=A0ABT7BZ97_9CYAN|nr:alpha-2-macroglobulin family protein [Roseofilum casamattae]MDJ1183771.1 alpha-2-macroglobulin family protein [Roseofilum casamattae BLCC-M143]
MSRRRKRMIGRVWRQIFHFPSHVYRRYRVGILLVLFIATLSGCRLVGVRSQNQPLATVSPLPLATPPAWIQAISPTEEAQPLNQINVIFTDPLIPLESLDSPDRKNLLKQFQITPNLPGTFRFLTPRMVGFQADRALPLATRVQVTLKQGLKDLNNHQLDRDFAWTFNTPGIQLTNLPGSQLDSNSNPVPLDINPQLRFTSNVELNLQSLEEHTRLVSAGSDRDIPINIVRDESNTFESAQTRFDPSRQQYDYIITPKKTLEKATPYSLEISAGLEPANGNLPSEIPFSSQFKTYNQLNFDELESYGEAGPGGAYGRFVQGSPQLRFNNPVVGESAIANISINPPPSPDAPPLVQLTYEPNIVQLNPWALSPDTNYTITIDPALEDQFGQTLDNPVTLQYETGNISPDIWVPSGLNILPSSKDIQLDISTVNLPDSEYQGAFRSIKPTDLVYIDSAYPQGDGKDILPPENQWQSYSVSGQQNQTLINSVNLREELGENSGMLAYGVGAKTNSYEEKGQLQWNRPKYYGLVGLTNLGVFAQWFPESGLVRVNHLDDGAPVSGAAVEIYQSKLREKNRPQPKACATGRTDELGLLQLTAPQLRQCMGGQRFEQAPELLVIAKENNDWAFTRTQSYSGAYGYGMYAGWSEDKPVSRGTIFSDRELYQPGEKAAFTIAAYYLQMGELKADKRRSYRVTIQDPKGKEIKLENSYFTNQFGTFAVETNIGEDWEVGDYQIRAESDRGLAMRGNFKVAEFKPPNFKVEVNVNRETAQPGDSITATANSNYLFGAPVINGNAEYYVTRSQAEIAPSGWESYSFGQQWFWPEEAPQLESDVLQSQQTLDDSGAGSKSFTIAKDIPYPMTYQVDVSVSDVSNLSVTNATTVTVLPSDRLIGLKSNFVADAGQPFPVEVIVTDAEGNAKAGEKVILELQKMTYSSVTRIVEGGRSDRTSVEYETVGQTTIKSNNNPVTAQLTPTESGSYRIRANLAGSKTDATASDLQIWATGAGGVRWGRGDEDVLEIKLDKDTYKPGETATALIQSPYEEGQLYFAIVRDKPLFQAMQQVEGGAPQVQFQITPEMLPNAAFEAVLVRQGKSLQTATGEIDNLVKVGFAPFQIDLSDRHLSVEVTPSVPQLQPGGQQTLQLQLKDEQNRNVQGQLTIMVVNEAILQLTGYRPPDLLDTVYAEQPISTRFSDNRPDVILQPQASPIAKGWGYGGGFSAGNANTRTRRDFQPLAYYNGSVITDAQGRATISFTLPDDLTTWRVMVVANDANLRFGNGETTFITNQPILTNPILPQFVRPGDRINAGLSVTNTTADTGNVEITGTLTGGLSFESTGNTLDTRQVQAGTGTIGERFPISAIQEGTATVTFSTRFNNQPVDAFEVPLEIKPLEITEQVVESGTTTSTLTLPVNVTEDTAPDTGGLQIDLASTLMPQIMASAKDVFGRNTLPFAEPAASQLLIAASLERLGNQYGQGVEMFDLPEKTRAALSQLAQLQQEDGGFSSYPSSRQSNPYITPYVAEALASASQAGFSLEGVNVDLLRVYLQELLANPEEEDLCTTAICKQKLRLDALIALAAWGNARNDFLSDIYSARDEYDTVTQIRLARYLSRFPAWKREADSLTDEIQESVYQTGRTATVNLPETYHWLSSPAIAQAEALRLFLSRNTPAADTGRLLTSLLNLRRNGTWGSTYNSARALSALVAYAQTESTPPNFAADVSLGGQQLGVTQFQDYENSTWSLHVPMAQLPPGNRDLVIDKSGEGKLHYLVSYGYRLSGNQPGRLNGLRVVRKVRAANEEKVLRTTGLYDRAEPFTTQTGRVFDVGLEIITDHLVNNVIINDFLPAGLEAINGEFKTDRSQGTSDRTSWNIRYQQMYKDRVVAYGDRLEPGIYELHYLARSVTPGSYLWPGAQAYLQHAPEEFGRSASSRLILQ